VTEAAQARRDAVRRSFERQTSLFAGPNSVFARHSESPLSWIEPLDEHMVVLDVACGAAHASEPVAPRVRHVIGIDLTVPLLQMGAQRLRDKGIDNVTLQEGDAEGLPFVDESFDIVYCRSSLHHFAHPERAVAEMVRVCRIGGRVVLVDLIAPTPDVRDHFDHVHRLIDPSHMHAFVERELAELLPGGIDGLCYAGTDTFQLAIDLVFTEQSDGEAVFEALRSELAGGEVTGFDPVENDGKILVQFATCSVQSERRA